MIGSLGMLAVVIVMVGAIVQQHDKERDEHAVLDMEQPHRNVGAH